MDATFPTHLLYNFSFAQWHESLTPQVRLNQSLFWA